MSEKKLTAVSLFSGAGGMDLGIKKAGFEIVWANDFNEDAVKTYKKNIGDHIIHGDISQISSENIKIEDSLDLVIGGFPCQGFSIANKNRSMKDERNFLYKEMLRIIRDKRPKFFIAENVKGLLSMENGLVIKMIIQDFENLGYKVDYRLLNSANYGVPQSRERVIIIGNRMGLENPFPKPTHEQKDKDLGCNNVNLLPYVTVEESIGFLSTAPLQNNLLEQYYEWNGRKIYNHIANENVGKTFFGRKFKVNQNDICDYLKFWRDKRGLTTKKIDDYFGYKHTAGHWFRKDNGSGSIPKPSDWWKLKELLQFDDKYDEIVTTYVEKPIKFEQSLRITNWDRPSDTITATSPEIHINKNRRLSVRECAILQSFPDDFVFVGSLNSMYRQVGNAVPVKLAYSIAKEIYSILVKNGEK